MTADTGQIAGQEQLQGIDDEEIRSWAKAAGKKVGDRGRIGAALRAEYLARDAELARDPGGVQPPAAGEGAPGAAGPGQPAEPGPQPRPRPARPEKQPQRVAPASRPLSGRIRSWLSGPQKPVKPSGGKPAAKSPAVPRTPLTRLISRGWGMLADVAEHVNVPVARCMEWQSPYIGLVLEDQVKNSVVDRVLQPVARAEEKLTGVGSVIAMPFLVAGLTMPGNTPEAGTAGVVRYQLLSKALEECVYAQLEMFGDGEFARRAARHSADHQAKSAQVTKILEVIFAAVPEPQDAREAAQAAQEEGARRDSIAVQFTPDPATGAASDGAQIAYGMPGVSMQRPEGADDRGQAAERAARAQAEAARRAGATAGEVLAAAKGLPPDHALGGQREQRTAAGSRRASVDAAGVRRHRLG
jgi:hypothetical protein